MTANHLSPTRGTPLYLDPGQPLDERVHDLIGRMTRAEKISQMLHECPAIPRLGIPAYNYWSEALHGVAANGRATVFPQAIGLAATWDPALVQQIASAIGDEARAKYHAALRRNGATAMGQGLTFWSPNINIFRDPRWGRGQETYGEDPHLTAEIGAAFVGGLQGDHPHYLKAAACAKHYAVHSGPEKDRHHFDAVVSQRDLHDTYLPAFKKLVTEARVEAVMGAYNRLYGVPCCASLFLLQELLRNAWQFKGHVVSDCWALTDIHAHHHYAADVVEAAAVALKAGCDISCGVTYDRLEDALGRGLVTEADIDRALDRTLATRFKLGLFDPPERVPYAAIPTSVIGCDKHRRLASEAARKSVVLLKNEASILPIDEGVQRIFITGPNASNIDVLLANYCGLNDSLSTLIEGITGRAPEGVKVLYRMGCQLTQPNANPLDWASPEAGVADVTIACMGLSPLIEGEEGESILSPGRGDRSELGLPEVQVEYIKQMAMNGAKIVLVLFGGSPLFLSEVADLVQAIVFAWYPGQEGGRAVAELLFGDESPSGKLPLTFPQSLDQLPPFEDYSMAGRTYRYSAAEPDYPFGFGLSYTRFAYRDLQLARGQIQPGEDLHVTVTLQNSGPVAGDEVVQFYLSDLEASAPVPLHKLVGFQRLRLAPGETRAISFTITPEMLHFVDEAGKPRFEPGRFRLIAGGCSPGERGEALGAPLPLSAEFELIS